MRTGTPELYIAPRFAPASQPCCGAVLENAKAMLAEACDVSWPVLPSRGTLIASRSWRRCEASVETIVGSVALPLAIRRCQNGFDSAEPRSVTFTPPKRRPARSDLGLGGPSTCGTRSCGPMRWRDGRALNPRPPRRRAGGPSYGRRRAGGPSYGRPQRRAASDRLGASLAGANSNAVVHGQHEDLAVADLPLLA